MFGKAKFFFAQNMSVMQEAMFAAYFVASGSMLPLAEHFAIKNAKGHVQPLKSSRITVPI